MRRSHNNEPSALLVLDPRVKPEDDEGGRRAGDEGLGRAGDEGGGRTDGKDANSKDDEGARL